MYRSFCMRMPLVQRQSSINTMLEVHVKKRWGVSDCLQHQGKMLQVDAAGEVRRRAQMPICGGASGVSGWCAHLHAPTSAFCLEKWFQHGEQRKVKI